PVQPVQQVQRVAPADDEDGNDHGAQDVRNGLVELAHDRQGDGGDLDFQQLQDALDEADAHVLGRQGGGGEELPADLHPRADAVDVGEQAGEDDGGGAEDDAQGEADGGELRLEEAGGVRRGEEGEGDARQPAEEDRHAAEVGNGLD